MRAMVFESAAGMSVKEFALELSPPSICTPQPSSSLINSWRTVSWGQFR